MGGVINLGRGGRGGAEGGNDGAIVGSGIIVDGGRGGATVGSGLLVPPPADKLAKCGNKANRFGGFGIGRINGVVGIGPAPRVEVGNRCKATVGCPEVNGIEVQLHIYYILFLSF